MTRALVMLALVLAVGKAPAAEPLGRLFFTPAQRVQLDVARSQKSRATLAADQEEAAPVPEIVTYSGVVRRNDGKTTVWINNRAVNDGKAADRLPVAGRLRTDGSVNLEVPKTGRKINLKVGDSFDIVSGTIAEPYARRPVLVKPQQAAVRDNSAAANPEGASQPPPGTRKGPDDDGPDGR